MSDINKDLFPKRISKVIKIKKISKLDKSKDKESSYKINNKTNNNENDFDNHLKGNLKKDNIKQSYKNIFSPKVLKEEKQLDINIKGSKYNTKPLLINQHTESIQLNSFYREKGKQNFNHHILLKKLNLNLIKDLDLNNPETKNQSALHISPDD